MSTKPINVPVRFLISGLLLIALWYIAGRLAFWSSVSREAHLAFLEGAVSAVALVLVMPVVIRGDRVQRMLAVALGLLPVFGLLDALLRAAGFIFGFRL
jgi:hypothetical protein